MLRIPEDIFSEPDVSPDTLGHLGPLRRLAGVWRADKGVDVNPKAGGPERKVFIEHVRMDPIDAQTNGPQLFYGLRYHIHINTPDEKITFHDQVGYWLWEPATGLILQSVTIPRGQALLASGRAGPDDMTISVSAKRGQTDYGICSNDFLEQAFRTDSYRLDITFHDDGSWSYLAASQLTVKGRDQPFDHHDANTLKRVSAATPNPLAGAQG
ncbi:FABP family protein [Methylopila henanensis]|uniref:FABP family protein n=1 Tax=Methylopila henanensis TaxID=873516 RepID=A0ABW4K6H7_9HYPH